LRDLGFRCSSVGLAPLDPPYEVSQPLGNLEKGLDGEINFA
jgi:hypothetical protein